MGLSCLRGRSRYGAAKPCDEFQGHTADPWNEGSLCGTLKRPPYTPGRRKLLIETGFFKELKCYQICKRSIGLFPFLAAKESEALSLFEI